MPLRSTVRGSVYSRVELVSRRQGVAQFCQHLCLAAAQLPASEGVAVRAGPTAAGMWPYAGERALAAHNLRAAATARPAQPGTGVPGGSDGGAHNPHPALRAPQRQLLQVRARRAFVQRIDRAAGARYEPRRGAQEVGVRALATRPKRRVHDHRVAAQPPPRAATAPATARRRGAGARSNRRDVSAHKVDLRGVGRGRGAASGARPVHGRPSSPQACRSLPCITP
jgi:hypothetical protein